MRRKRETEEGGWKMRRKKAREGGKDSAVSFGIKYESP